MSNDSSNYNFNSASRDKNSPLFWAILVSCGLHIFLVLSLGIYSHLSTSNTRNETVEVSFIDAEELEKLKKDEAKTIVETDEKMANETLNEKAKFLSAKNNSVEKETKAKTGEKFKNSQQIAFEKLNSPQQQAKEKLENRNLRKKSDRKSQIFATDFDAYSALSKKYGEQADQKRETASAKKSIGQLARSTEGSTTTDNLKDVESEFMTRLNTREFKYYGYYNRIKTQLNQWWVPQVQQKFSKMVRQGRGLASEESKVTKLIIVLNDVGNLVKVQVLAESGVRDLDDAAVEAFRQAAPFPNPPKGMIESDGTVRIRWDCVVES